MCCSGCFAWRAKKKGLFAPHSGMLYESNALNRKLATNNKLPCVEIDLNEDSAPYYSLCDSFHLKSKKKTPSRSF